MRSIWQDLALLFAGAFASITGSLLIKTPVSTTVTISLITIMTLLVLYGSGAATIAKQRLLYWARHGRGWLQPRIGILSDMGWDEPPDPETYTWTDFSPQQWRSVLMAAAVRRGKRASVKLISASAEFDAYFAVINPYGGVYPEQDLAELSTLEKIFGYVRRGGLFVNVADVPGYWAYSELLERKLDATPAILERRTTPQGDMVIEAIRPFFLTPFLVRLGLQIERVENSPLAHWNAGISQPYRHLDRGYENLLTHRVSVVVRNTDPVLAPVAQPGQDVKLLTPFFFTNFGAGRFLISLLPLDQSPNREVPTLIADLLIDGLN